MRQSYKTKQEALEKNPRARFIYVFKYHGQHRWAASMRCLKIANTIDLIRQNPITYVELFHKKNESLEAVFKMS